MRFNEFNDGLQRFTATVRVVGKTSSITTRTAIYAESPTHGRAMLERMYGVGNVLSISQAVTEQGSSIDSPQEQQVKSMSDQAKRLQQQAKQVKARNKLAKAQHQLVKATSQSVNH